MAAWVENGLREQLFAKAPAAAEVWVGDVSEIGSECEIVPMRFAGLDFWVLFLSPHAQAGHDEEFLRMMLDTADAGDFVPVHQSRLIKFCRAEAEEHHFKPEEWDLPKPEQIFQFLGTLGDVMRLYLASAPEIQQFLYLPASNRLARLYARLFKQLSKDLGGEVTAILQPTGACHAYQRVQGNECRGA